MTMELVEKSKLLDDDSKQVFTPVSTSDSKFINRSPVLPGCDGAQQFIGANDPETEELEPPPTSLRKDDDGEEKERDVVFEVPDGTDDDNVKAAKDGSVATDGNSQREGDSEISRDIFSEPVTPQQPLTFTINFGDDKEVDTARYRNLFERYNARHRRNLSTSKVRRSIL